MRHHWPLRHPRRYPGRPCRAAAHERLAAASGARRGKPSHRTGPRIRPPASVHHRCGHRPAAAVQRRRIGGRDLQRRDLQLPGTDPRIAGGRTPLPYQERHRSHRARLGAMGRGLRRALSRHVRLRAVGSQPADAVHGARPVGRQAAVLRAAGRRHPAVRQRTEVAAGVPGAAGRWTESRHRPAGRRGVFRARVRRRAAHHLSPGEEAAAGSRPRHPAWRSGRRAARILGRALHPGQPHQPRRRLRRTAASSAGIGAPADDLGSSSRCIPVRRCRFQRRGGDDGRAVEWPGQHLLHRVRRPEIQRE